MTESNLLNAVNNDDLDTVKQLCSNPEVDMYEEFDNGKTVLMIAASKGNAGIVQELLDAGASWNAIDSEGKCAGQIAQEHGHDHIHDLLLSHAVRTELILSLLERKASQTSIREGPSNEEYLNKKVMFKGDVLVDESGDAVMMSWEKPLMKWHARKMDIEGKDVLNVGFGLGIIDKEFQKYSPRSHTIVEAHPDVYQKMLEDGWDKIPGVTILFGRWQDVLMSSGLQFDSIFFDTFGEFYEDMREFHDDLLNILRPGGIYSFFNGLAGKNEFFHQVYCQIAELELSQLGFTTEFHRIPIDPSDPEIWNGILRKYWTLKYYNLPICRLVGL